MNYTFSYHLAPSFDFILFLLLLLYTKSCKIQRRFLQLLFYHFYIFLSQSISNIEQKSPSVLYFLSRIHTLLCFQFLQLKSQSHINLTEQKNNPASAYFQGFAGFCPLFKLGKLLFYVKLFCLGFATKMPIF